MSFRDWYSFPKISFPQIFLSRRSPTHPGRYRASVGKAHNFSRRSRRFTQINHGATAYILRTSASSCLVHQPCFTRKRSNTSALHIFPCLRQTLRQPGVFRQISVLCPPKRLGRWEICGICGICGKFFFDFCRKQLHFLTKLLFILIFLV